MVDNRVQRVKEVIQNLEKVGLVQIGIGTKFALYLESTCNFTIKDDNFELLKLLVGTENISKLEMDDQWKIVSDNLKTVYLNIINAIKSGDNEKVAQEINENKELILGERLLDGLEDLVKILSTSRVEDSLFVYNLFVGNKLDAIKNALEKLAEHGTYKNDTQVEIQTDDEKMSFDNTELEPVMKSVRLNNTEYTWDDAYELIKGQVEYGHCILLRGVPGTGKTTMALEFVDRFNKENKQSENMKFISFTKNTNSSDFIYGVVSTEDGWIGQSGVFKQLCDEAIKHPEKMYFMVIDEFTRGDTAAVLSEALTGMDRRNTPISLGRYKEKLIVPDNICIIATMNSGDQSTIEIDQAVLDRFYVLNVEPIWMNESGLDVLCAGLGIKPCTSEKDTFKVLYDTMKDLDGYMVKRGDLMSRIGTRAIQKCKNFKGLRVAVESRIIPRLDVNEYGDYIKELTKFVDTLII